MRQNHHVTRSRDQNDATKRCDKTMRQNDATKNDATKRCDKTMRQQNGRRCHVNKQNGRRCHVNKQNGRRCYATPDVNKPLLGNPPSWI